ncbi:MAG: hypothetical protein K2Q18_14645, partial [Bdellovibrionales bacterium]|nr:hypothetical protein [Bdellovibrionales bacterium]
MKGLSQISLARKLTVSAIILLACCIIAITFMTYLKILQFGNDYLNAELDQRSELIKKAFSEPIWTYDQYQIEEIGNSLIGDFKYTFINAIKVETTSNEVLFEKGQDNLGFAEASA